MKSLAAGFKGEVAVVDFSNDILSEFLSCLRDYDPVTDATEEVLGIHETNPQAIRAAAELLALGLKSETAARTHFYSARDEPVHKVAAVPKKAAAKRLTTAVLAEQISSLSAQVALLAAALRGKKKGASHCQWLGLPLPLTPQGYKPSHLQG